MKSDRDTFELDGKIYFVQYSGKKEISRTEVDGNLVVRLLEYALQRGIQVTLEERKK